MLLPARIVCSCLLFEGPSLEIVLLIDLPIFFIEAPTPEIETPSPEFEAPSPEVEAPSPEF